MGKVGILTEKPSAARNFAAALGGMSGTFEGTEYVIVHARGHLLELKDPAAMVPAPLTDKYKSWELEHLPWNADDFRWEREIRRRVSGGKLVTDPDAKSLLRELKTALSGCETICNAADLDPTGEGSLLGWEIVEYLGLEKRNVGTGATRTSTYAEVTNNNTGKALMVEQRGTITLSAIGELNHRILPGTHIGDLTITEQVFEQMAQIQAGTGEAADYLSLVADLVRRDLETMKANASTLSGELTARMGKAGVTREAVEMIELPPELHFTHEGTVITRAKRVFGGHRFTDTEVAALLAGEVIEIVATSAKSGKTFTCTGKLEPGVREKDGKQYPHVSFNPQFAERAPRTDLVSGVWKGKPVTFKGRGWGANDHWPGKDFTEQELEKLLAGGTIEFDATSKTGKTYRAKGALAAGTYQGSKTFGFKLKFEDRKTPSGSKKRAVRR